MKKIVKISVILLIAIVFISNAVYSADFSLNLKTSVANHTLGLILKGINFLENIIKERKLDFQPFKDIYTPDTEMTFAWL